MATKDIKQGDPVMTGGLAAITSPTVIPDEASRLDRIGILADKYSPLNILGAGLDALTLGAESGFDYLLSPDPYGEAKAAQEAKDQAYLEDVQRRVAEKQAADAAAMDALRADSMDIFSDMEIANRNRDPRFITGPNFSGAQSEVRGTGEGPPESRLADIPEEPSQPTGEATDAVEAFMREQESNKSTQTTEQESGSIYEKLMQDSVNSLNEMLGKDPSESTSIEDYKREFSEATGIDVSGDPDNKAALMAFGLALMQNKAGKGFNVGNMLSAVGKAGSEAQPLMIQARKEARAAQLAGGKYALEQRAKDRANAAAAIQAEQERIFELQKLKMKAEDEALIEQRRFENEYKLERLKNEMNPPTVDMYTDKTEKIKLFEGAPDIFTVNSYIADPNVKGNVPVKLTPGSAETLAPALRSAEEDLNKVEQDLEFIANVAINDGITVPDQFISATRSLGRAFGINVEGELDSVAKAKQVLRKIEVLNTAEILGEAGKTISDADRNLVKDIVGQISALNPMEGADAQKLISKLGQLHNIIVKKGRRNLDTAYGRLHAAGYSYGPYAEQEQQPTSSMNVGDTQEINGVTVKRVK